MLNYAHDLLERNNAENTMRLWRAEKDLPDHLKTVDTLANFRNILEEENDQKLSRRRRAWRPKESNAARGQI